MNEERQLIFCGDIHGEIRELVFNLTERYNIENADVIVLGDFGVGFDNSLENIYKRIEKKLKKNNITIWALRGNHDRLEGFFDGTGPGFEYLKFLQDHKVIEICGRTIYPIGGAVSLDQEWRKEENKKLEDKGSSSRVWWPSEEIIQKKKDLPLKVDIIISHEAPLTFEPVISRNDDLPLEIYEKIISSRKYLDWILLNVRCSYWMYGHYHKFLSGTYGETLYHCLGIQQLFTIYNYVSI